MQEPLVTRAIQDNAWLTPSTYRFLLALDYPASQYGMPNRTMYNSDGRVQIFAEEGILLLLV